MATSIDVPVIEAPDTPPSLASELEAKDELSSSDDTSLEQGSGKVEVSEDDKSQDTPATPAEPIADYSKELQDLRAIIRSQRMHMRGLQDQLSKLQAPRSAGPAPKTSSSDDTLDEVFGERKAKVDEPPAAPQMTRFEMLQRELMYLGETKGPMLDTLIATMEMNPAYADIHTVCDRSNLDYLIDLAVPSMVEKQDLDPVEAAMAIEAAIWRMPNPYKWIYDKVKEIHPSYRKVEASAPAANKGGSAKPAEPKVPPEAPPSVIPHGGGSGDTGLGWTAAKLDALSEEDYAKVPESIRSKYLSGELA